MTDEQALHEESYEQGREDAQAGRPDRAFEITVDQSDRVAYEAGRSDAFKIEIPTELPPADPNPPPSMSAISKDDEERAKEYTKEVERVREFFGETPEPHAEYGELKPGDVDPATGKPVPVPPPWNPGVDPAAE